MANFDVTKFFGLFNFCFVKSGTLRCGYTFGCRGTGVDFHKLQEIGVISKKKKKVITFSGARFLSFPSPDDGKRASQRVMTFFFFFRDHPNFL